MASAVAVVMSFSLSVFVLSIFLGFNFIAGKSDYVVLYILV